MKIIVLGGYGKTGIPALKLLAQFDIVTEIAIAGRNLERAEKAVTEIGVKACAVQVDGTDEQRLTAISAGYDLLMNAATNDAVLPALEAAIHNRIHYCDMSSGSIVKEALQLSAEAERSGITAILANGIHPSNTNLMGVHVARQLDEVEQLQLGEASVYDFPTGNELIPDQWLREPDENLAALQAYKPVLSWILQMLQENGSRTVLDYRGGKWVDMDPMRNGIEVPLAQGGTAISYPYFSSDPIFASLPNDLSRVKSVEMFFTPLPSQLHTQLHKQALRVLEGKSDAAIAINTLFDIIESDPYRWLTLPEGFAAPAKHWVRAVGRKDGRAARHNCWLAPAAWDLGGYFLTSAAVVVAALTILSGEIQTRGVLNAEKAFDPLPYFNKITAMAPEIVPEGTLISESFEWLE